MCASLGGFSEIVQRFREIVRVIHPSDIVRPSGMHPPPYLGVDYVRWGTFDGASGMIGQPL